MESELLTLGVCRERVYFEGQPITRVHSLRIFAASGARKFRGVLLACSPLWVGMELVDER